MAEQEPRTPHPSPPSDTSWRIRFRSFLPFGVTAVVSIALSLLLQAMFFPVPLMPAVVPTRTPFPTHQSSPFPPYQPSPFPTPTRSIPTPVRQPTPYPTLPPQEETLMQQSKEIRNLWSAYYLARAASQLADAEAAMRSNDLEEVRQVLVTVRVSLDSAYEQGTEQHKGPIQEFRLQISAIYEELYNRPEHMDQRMRRLRQSMLSLVDEDH